MRPKLKLLKGSVLTSQRYTYGEHVLFGDHVAYGGTGVFIESNDEYKIKLSTEGNTTSKISLQLKKVVNQDIGETYELVTLEKGSPIGLLLSLTYNDNYQYTKHIATSGYVDALDDGPQLEVLY